MTLPFFQGLTLGGILATASHGTGDKVASALADMVVEAVWVDAAGKVRVHRGEGGKGGERGRGRGGEGEGGRGGERERER